MATRDVGKLRSAHKVVAEFDFEVVPVKRGYADRTLRIDLETNQITMPPVTQQMKDLWVGGKGFDLWLMLQEISKETKWDSRENPICFCSGPLGGTTSFPGSGKTIVTAVSPSTGSVMDCNVGGFFGPFLKFSGFDALAIVGKAPEETIVVIDAVQGRITIERSPAEKIDTHLLVEELTEMYAADELDKRNIAIVSSGRAAEHSRMGVLNFSFYDWRKRTARVKQAGRGGIGTVFRNKQLKALVLKNRGITPAWRVAESKVAPLVTPRQIPVLKDPQDRAVITAALDKWHRDPEYVIDMLQEIQDHFGYLPKVALTEITEATRIPTAYLYHTATFLDGFTLEPRGATVIRVCTGTTCQVLGTRRIVSAFEQALGIRAGETTADGRFTLLTTPCLGACSAGPTVQLGDAIYGNVAPDDVAALLEGHRTGRPPEPAGGAQAPPLSARRLAPPDAEAVAREGEAARARSRGLLAIASGRRTPTGAASTVKKPPSSQASGRSIVLTGCIERPGRVAVPAGATLRQLIEELGGGIPGGKQLKAVQIGGPAGGLLTAEQLDEEVDFAALTPPGAMTGPDRTIVMDESICPVEFARSSAAALLAQSCGKCAPCREGLHALSLVLGRLCRGQGTLEDLMLIEEIGSTMQETSFCQFGVSAPNPILSALRAFRAEFEEHARDHACRAGVCNAGEGL